MIPLDITSLETNIRVIVTSNIMKDYVNNDDQFIRKTAILQDKFLDWLDYVLATTWYTFHSRFYIQTDGVAKGGPVSSTTAEIYIYIYAGLWKTAILTALHPPKVWEKFI